MTNLIFAAIGITVSMPIVPPPVADALQFQSVTGSVILSVGSKISGPVTLRNADGSLVASYLYDGTKWILSPKEPLGLPKAKYRLKTSARKTTPK